MTALEQQAIALIRKRASIADRIAKIKQYIGQCSEASPGDYITPAILRCTLYPDYLIRFDNNKNIQDPETVCESCARYIMKRPLLLALYDERRLVLAATLRIGRRLNKDKS